MSDLVLNITISFSSLHESYEMLSYHFDEKRGQGKTKLKVVEKRYWGRVRVHFLLRLDLEGLVSHGRQT